VTLVAVAPNKHACGVECDADDWRAPRGSDRNCRAVGRGERKQIGVPSPYEVMDLTNAIGREYRSDAHMVSYIMRDPRGAVCMTQPRVNIRGLTFVRSLGYTLAIECLLADVDNPGHVPWTDELRAIAREQDRRLETAGVYYSANGRRIVQPLTRPIEIDEAQEVCARIAAWLDSLRDLGLHPDPLIDWGRHMRMPHVRRAPHGFQRSEHVDLSRMQPIDPPEPTIRQRSRAPRRSTLELRDAGDIATSSLAKAFAAAGWLGHSLGPGKVTSVCPFASGHSIGREHDSSTVLFGPTQRHPRGYWHCSHASCARRSQDEAIAALPAEARALLEDAPEPVSGTRPTRAIVSHAEARAELEQAFRSAPDGLSVVIAGCGTGKTEAAIAVAQERAARRGGGPQRAPLHSRTAISVPTTKLAREVADRIAARGASVRRIFGPLSVRAADGRPECRIHECASAFAAGGLSVPWELCEGRGRSPCEHASSCAARGGVEGPEDARIVVGPHQLLSRLSEAAGATGLLVIDEPPPLIAHEVLTIEQLVTTARDLDRYFESRYASALAVSLHALAAWISVGPLEAPTAVADGVAKADPELLERAYEATGATTAVEAAREAFEPRLEGDERPRSTSPPVTRQSVAMARSQLWLARAVGEASRVARLVQTALAGDPTHTRVRIEERQGRRVLILTGADVQLRETLRRDGSVVVADAGGRQHLEVYRMTVGYDPTVTEVYAEDGAPIRRVHLRRRASRAAWMVHGRLTVDVSLVRALEGAVDWLLEEQPARAALVTFMPLELALRAAGGEDVRHAWVRAGQAPEALEEVASRLRPAWSRLAVHVDLGHYGGVRGLDHWRDHDALVTLGDPWGQLTDGLWEAELLRLGDGNRRLEEAARHELEQAHGRLRTVHRQRPASALHVGMLVPGGWTSHETREATMGRPRTLSRDEAQAAIRRHGGVSQAARALGVARTTLRRDAH